LNQEENKTKEKDIKSTKKAIFKATGSCKHWRGNDKLQQTNKRSKVNESE